ncbi:cytochrome c [Pseudomonas sp. RIT-PI-S]|uniref:c-type cytochrome n=1 Tax=Pseudomonas sp. RIT-PI-S TaxID=3035295 RepID=UPI0021D822E6|nr:cytochrome c [Pseudomonas sp. RIT-PI-S]
MKRAIRSAALLCAGVLCLPLTALAGTGADSWNLVEQGRYIATLGDCTACHTAPGGRPFAGGVVIDTPFGKLVGANITPDPTTGIGGWSFEDFYKVMSEGHSPGNKRLYGAMPYTAYTKVTRDDNLALWAYLQTLEPVANPVQTNQLPFPFNQRLALVGWNWLNFKKGAYAPDPTRSPQWNRGAYLVQGLGHCGTCHTPKNLSGGDDNSRLLQGANLQAWVAPNITADAHEGLGRWSEADLLQYLKTGANRFDVASGPMAEAVEHSLQYWKDEDLKAVVAYLKDGDNKAIVSPAVAANSAAMSSGKALYADRCSGCHTPNGEGIPGLFPKLANAPLVNSPDPASLIRVVLAGNRAGSTDAAPTGPAMPAFGWNLSDQHVADVVTFIRNSWGNAAPAVDAGEVKDVRETLQQR